MNFSTRAKALIGAGLLVASLIWLILFDYGINAGRIHYGVHVTGVDVGGMTVDEAHDTLRRHAAKLREAPVVLSAEGMECSFNPSDVGWRPRPKGTALNARGVGFRSDLSTDLRERTQTWFAGVEVGWAAELNASKVRSLIGDCESQAKALHLALDRERLRRLIGRAIVTWPRRIFEIPVTTSD